MSKAILRFESQPEPVISEWTKVAWSLDAPGPIHGAILVERARTFGGKLINLRWNVERLQIGARTLGFTEAPGESGDVTAWYRIVCQLLLEVNRELLGEQDVSIVVLFSPLESGDSVSWQSIAYLAPLPKSRLDRWYHEGSDLQTTAIGIFPDHAFPTSIKHRSRIHYWLADRQARGMNPNATAVLMDHEERLGDTSVANLLLIDENNNWFTPSEEWSHHGTTLKQSIELLRHAGTIVTARTVKLAEVSSCREIILAGSTGVVWSANSWNGIELSQNRPNCQMLQSLWKNYLGFDFVANHATGVPSEGC